MNNPHSTEDLSWLTQFKFSKKPSYVKNSNLGPSSCRRSFSLSRENNVQSSSLLSDTPVSIESYNVTYPIRIEHPDFILESQRLKSFESWPKGVSPKPEQLTNAGFYYTGKGDRVCCFSCGGGLKDWEENDQPWEQHARWYSKCQYLKLMKGKNYIIGVLNQTTSKSSHIKEPKNERLCKICFEFEYNSVFVPCGHVLACSKCASTVTKCPCCRQNFTNVMQIYFS
jgi:Inhibitor of Apoptosis domain/Zinc finger, C3HC4 type (RING finger)